LKDTAMDTVTRDPAAVLATGVVLVSIVRIDQQGVPWISLGGGMPVAARCLSSLTPGMLEAAHGAGGQAVAVLENADPALPILIGVLGPAAAADPAAVQKPATPALARVDGRRVELTGRDEVVLSCGKASITLTKAGKVILAGTFVSSSAVGVNRITGGSVQIN
jgi:hypothetical protein